MLKAIDMLKSTGMLESKPCDFPIEQNHQLCKDKGELIKDVTMYRRLVGGLLYLTITRPDIAYAVGIVSRFMHEPRKPHLDAVYRIRSYIKSCPGKGIFLSSKSGFVFK